MAALIEDLQHCSHLPPLFPPTTAARAYKTIVQMPLHGQAKAHIVKDRTRRLEGVNGSRFQFSFECGHYPKIYPKARKIDSEVHSSQLVTK
jgi:hypothetical protein